jgi:uncharacterized protein
MVSLAAARVHPDTSELSRLCRQYRVQKLSLYGSVLRDDFRPDSDIDILVEFEAGAGPTLFTLGALLADLEDLVGRLVDLKTPGDFPPVVREQVLATAEPLYAAE